MSTEHCEISTLPLPFLFRLRKLQNLWFQSGKPVDYKRPKAIIHPIAGTFKHTGNVETDLASAEALRKDPKENAEHTMLVDLARNDLSIMGKNTTVSKLKEIHFFSHVIHMVSEVTADVAVGTNPFEMIATTFPQGTLSGAPKYMAMELIDKYEKLPEATMVAV